MCAVPHIRFAFKDWVAFADIPNDELRLASGRAVSNALRQDSSSEFPPASCFFGLGLSGNSRKRLPQV